MNDSENDCMLLVRKYVVVGPQKKKSFYHISPYALRHLIELNYNTGFG